jgi:type IV pilus assembly protein PilY1
MSNATATAAWFNPFIPAEGTMNLTVDNTWTRQWVLNDDTSPSAALTFYPATHFSYTGAGSAPTAVGDAANIAGNYTLVEIKPANAPFTKATARTDCAGTTCTYTEEMQNFANWFSYYRSRILTARAGTGRAFARQGTAMRVGFAAINKGSTTIDGTATRTVVGGVRDFSGTGRTTFFANLYGHTMPPSGTPLRQALGDVGQYFKWTTDTGPWGQFPGTGGGTQFACRQNYNILMTDGYWNGAQASTAAARLNVDATNGTLKTSSGTPTLTYTYTAGNPYSDATANTLADVAMYYWVNDLRTDMLNKIVPPNAKDPAFWQHMVNFTVGLGVYGTIPKTTIDAAFTAINATPPTTPPTIVWPAACDGCTTNNVDDLAHAALNSRGNYFSAADPDTFAASLTDALDDIVARTGSAAAVAVANANVSSGDNAAYASSYNSGTWTGDLDAFSLDLTTGIQSATSLWTSGTAQTQLNLRTPAVTNRFIVSYSGTGFASSGVQFQSSAATLSATITSKLSAAQETRLNTPTLTDGAAVLAYLRGDRTGETASTYRTRAHLLGDIINAEPVVIRAPARRYFDSGYTAFKTAQASRTKMVVQAANDGMVHVFNATTGAENWAYVPNLLIQTDDPANSGTSVLNMLSRKTYAHRMFIDATPFAGDVDFSNTDGIATGTAPDWRTLLVGGLGKGGRGVYALDMTNPSVSGESGAAANVLWEFPNATTDATVKLNVGYVFGRPVIVKTRAKGWVVLVASGYNNGTGTDNSGGDGHGYLFVLNARTGELISAIDTTVGSTADPSGLAHLSAFVEDADYNNTVSYVYGGDLKGNVWRFNLSDRSDYTQWGVKRLAILKDGSGGGANTQPVTTEPRLATINVAGAYKRFVYVATGRYLGDTDVPTSASETLPGSQTQTIYALVDDLTNPSGITPVISDNLRTSLQGQTFVRTATTATVTTTAVNYLTKKGWYIDLADTGVAPSERVNTHPALAAGALILTANTPSSDACLPGGSSWLYVLDYSTGGALTTSTTGLAGIKLGDALASRPVVILLPSGAIKVLIRTSDGKTLTPETGISTPPAQVSKRAATREILNLK